MPPKDLAVGARVQGPLIVLDVEARGGDTPHTILTLGDAEGRLQSAPFWAADGHRLHGITRGCVVQVTGTIGAYRDRRQLVVHSIEALPPERIDWSALLPSVGEVTGYWSAIDRWRAEVRTPWIGRVLGLFYDDPAFRERYERCPASTGGHHAALGGLLQHTCEVVRIGLALCRLYPAADADLVLAGILLHDIGKLESYRWDGVFELTIPGSVIGHVVLGSLLLDRRVRALVPPPCSEAELLLLQHLVLSHHGKLEFGSPVPPMTLEAELIHHADDASAKATSMHEALQDPANFANDRAVSARPIWQLERRRVWRSSGFPPPAET